MRKRMWMAGAAAALAAVALGRSPGDFWTGGGTEPAVWSPYLRTLSVYGAVGTNDVAVFMDRTGNRLRGTNMAEQVRGWAEESAGTVSNALNARIDGIATNYLRAVEYEPGVFQLFLVTE